MSWLFAGVQKFLQISIFSLTGYRGCSPLFARVGVKLVSVLQTHSPGRAGLYHGEVLRDEFHLWTVRWRSIRPRNNKSTEVWRVELRPSQERTRQPARRSSLVPWPTPPQRPARPVGSVRRPW